MGKGAPRKGAHVGIRRKPLATLSRDARGNSGPGFLPQAVTPFARRPELAGRPIPAKSATAVTAAAPPPPPRVPRRAHQPSHHTRTARLALGPSRLAPPSSPCPFRIMARWRQGDTCRAGSRVGAAAARARTRRHAGLTRFVPPMANVAPPPAEPLPLTTHAANGEPRSSWIPPHRSRPMTCVQHPLAPTWQRGGAGPRGGAPAPSGRLLPPTASGR